MERSRLTWVATLLAVLVAASLAATANASAAGTDRAGSAANSSTSSSVRAVGGQVAGNVQVGYAVNQFVTHNGRLYARGEVIVTVRTASGTRVARKPFQTVVRSASAPRASGLVQQQEICTVLVLVLGPLDLNLLGLIIELDTVILLIRADPEGGLLGDLLCGLAGGPAGVTATPAAAGALTRAVHSSRVASGAVTTAAQPLVTQQLPPVPEGHCTVLDLMLGPLHLELLGLIVDLFPVHLRITADPEGGLLGQLLCGLAGGVPPPPA
jgi:hypothetical protein